MKLPLDAIIMTDGNRAAFQRIVDITQDHDEPVRLFLVGPKESGKTTALMARQMDKDLLSTKKVLYRPCSELPEAMRANVYDGYFEDLGSHDVLLLDDFEGFFEDAEMGPMLCKLLLQERARQGLDTVISAEKPLSEFDLSEFGGMLDDFEEVAVEPLSGDALVAYVAELQDTYREEGKSPVLSAEAIAYIAHDLGEPPSMMRKAVHFLMDKYEGEPGRELSREDVERALK